MAGHTRARAASPAATACLFANMAIFTAAGIAILWAPAAVWHLLLGVPAGTGAHNTSSATPEAQLVTSAFGGMCIMSNIPQAAALLLPSAVGLTALALVCGAAVFGVVGTAAVLQRSTVFASVGASPNLPYYWLATCFGLFCANVVSVMSACLAIDGVRDAFADEAGAAPGASKKGGGRGGGGADADAASSPSSDTAPLLINGAAAAADADAPRAQRWPGKSQFSDGAAAAGDAAHIATAKAAQYKLEEEAAKAARARGYGTRRLLQLAEPHRVWLYAGCAVLFIRLPFSLSMPHWVSEVIGALIVKDWDKAGWNIVYLSIAGTVDSIMDFWCVYLFGLAQQRIIRGLRLDLFKAILWQDVGFYDTNETGEVTSRLTADCAEMASVKKSPQNPPALVFLGGVEWMWGEEEEEEEEVVVVVVVGGYGYFECLGCPTTPSDSEVVGATKCTQPQEEKRDLNRLPRWCRRRRRRRLWLGSGCRPTT